MSISCSGAVISHLRTSSIPAVVKKISGLTGSKKKKIKEKKRGEKSKKTPGHRDAANIAGSSHPHPQQLDLRVVADATSSILGHPHLIQAPQQGFIPRKEPLP